MFKFQSVFYSPRGFANEGTYIYGTREEVKEFFDRRNIGTDYDAGWYDVRYHRRIDTARNRAETETRQARRMYQRNSELCNICAHHVSDI